MGELDVQFGPLLLGVSVNIYLYGLMTMQTFEYFRNNRRDATWVSCFVIGLFLADTMDTGLSTATMYYTFVTGFGNPAVILKAPWYFASASAMTGIIAGAVQLFLAYRIKRLTQLNWMFYIIVTTALGQAAAAIVVAVGNHTSKDTVDNLRAGLPQTMTWLILAVVTDILIAGTFVIFMQRHKTGFSATDDLISRITRMTIQTGLLTTVCALLDLAMFIAFGNSLYVFFNYALPKLYSLSLMSSLNARNRWGRETTSTLSHGPQTDEHITRGRSKSHGAAALTWTDHGPTSTNRGVTVSKVVQVHEDGDMPLSPGPGARRMSNFASISTGSVLDEDTKQNFDLETGGDSFAMTTIPPRG